MFARVKRLASMVFRKTQYRIFTLFGAKIDYAEKVGDGLGSSTVAAVVNWVARTFPEAPPMLWVELDDGQEEQLRQHPLLRLLRKPNPFYTGIDLWMATVTDWMVDGNAYWLKIRNRAGEVVQLWWVPHWMIEPKGNETTFISHYEYRPGSHEMIPLAADDVVHFRFGMDTDDPKVGHSQLKSVLREVFTDDEAANFTASLLTNMGVPGLVISPEKGTNVSPEDGLLMKQYVKDRFGGDKRGEAMVMTSATKVEQFGFSPEQLMLRELRRIPEERVSAVTGIPAIVVGFGAGLERSTFTNMGEAREAAYEAGLIPTQRSFSEQVWQQLLPDFMSEEEAWRHRFGFDLSKVRVLQEDLYRQTQRLGLAIRDGYAMVSEARRPIGLEVKPERDDVFLRPANIVTVPEGEAGKQVSLPSSNGNGNGSAHHLTPEALASAVEQMLDRRDLVSA